MYEAIRYRLAKARLADQYCQALRDAAMHPAIHYDLTRARISRRPVSLWNRLRDLSRPGLNSPADRSLLLSSYFEPDPVSSAVERILSLFRWRIVLWDDLKERLRPWRRPEGE